MHSFINLVTLLITFLLSVSSYSKTVRYELVVKNEKLNLSGKKEVDFALTVNGGIPAPTLEFTEGDDAEILVKNELSKEEVSIHWHGILLPPEEDGVPYVNTPPIFAGASRIFKFKIRQSGTYWYHSHTAVQEQKGVYGAFIIHPKKKDILYDKEAVVVMSDWSDENADKIIRNLRKDGDYYLYKKDSMRSYLGAIQARELKSYLSNELQRMGGMDLSDVGYDAFLINGKTNSQLLIAHPGERIRLRIINAGASSYFYVSLAGLPMTVISADGIDIEPVQAKELLIGMAETYDILFTVPDHKNYEFRATVQDVTGFSSAWIGMGEKVSAPNKPLPDLYAAMNHGSQGTNHLGHGSSESESESEKEVNSSGHKDHAFHAHHTTGPIIETLTVDSLKSIQATTLPPEANRHDVKLVLGGDMERYIWHINGKSIHEDRLLMIDRGDVVRFTFQNETMMHHPMHFHGHFFRVINEYGEYSPLKHTVDIPPHGSRTIEFYANEPGQWMLHCHNLYHMKTGMARVVRYNDFVFTPEMSKLDKQDPHLHQHIYSHTKLRAGSNHAKGQLRLMRIWDELDLEIETVNIKGKNFSLDEKRETEGDLFYRRWFSNYLNFFAGGSLDHKDVYATIGIAYTLPMLIETAVSTNHKGQLRVDVEKRFQWTKSLFTEAEITWHPNWKGKRETEFEVSLMYGPAWNWAAGIMITQENLSLATQIQF